MATNPDFKDLFAARFDAQAEFILVGAHAVMVYTGRERSRRTMFLSLDRVVAGSLDRVVAGSLKERKVVSLAVGLIDLREPDEAAEAHIRCPNTSRC